MHKGTILVEITQIYHNKNNLTPKHLIDSIKMDYVYFNAYV